MYAQPACLRDGVHEALERGASRQGEVVALAKVGCWNVSGREALHEAGYVGSVDPRAVDDRVGLQAGLFAIDTDQRTARVELEMSHRAIGDKHGASALCLS